MMVCESWTCYADVLILYLLEICGSLSGKDARLKLSSTCFKSSLITKNVIMEHTKYLVKLWYRDI